MTQATHPPNQRPERSPDAALLFPSPVHRAGPELCAIPRDGLLLGRGARVFEAPFDDATLAVRHAEIRIEGAQIVVRDLDGGARTRVNGAALLGPHPLEEGDVLRIGETVLLFTTRPLARAAEPTRTGVSAELVGQTPSMEAVRKSVEAVAPHPRTVVVTGETGTGKEVVARLLHGLSGRAGPFVAVNCSGFTEGLLASELFGHLRGAFTGAVAEEQGLFRAARGGTLLLDEAGDLPLSQQASLLRVLETREVRPVGSARGVAVDVRVIAASNRELIGLVQQGVFRADLYARLAQWVIRLPPLRDRRADIPAIARALLVRLGEAGRALGPDLEEAVLVHPWPLNVRGLMNVLSVAAIASPPGGRLELGAEVKAALQDNLVEQPPTLVHVPSVVLDRSALEALLVRFGGRVAESARQAGISRPKLYRLLWAEGLDPAAFRRPGRASMDGPAPAEEEPEEPEQGAGDGRPR